MDRSLALIGCALVVSLAGPVIGAPWNTVVFEDDFGGVNVGEPPDPALWIINHPESDWWVQGRSFFPSQVHHPGAPFPWVDAIGDAPTDSNGRVCVIEHHRYNPYDLPHDPGTPKWTFLGGEIHSKAALTPGTCYRITARVRCLTYPDGLVTSFFTYGYDGSLSDEIDFEFLSNKTNDNAQYPDGDPVLTNPWNESVPCAKYAYPDGLDLGQWNTFRIYWCPAVEVRWTWLDGDTEVELRKEDMNCLPDESMSVYFNFWAPTDAWPDAYNAGYTAGQDPGDQEIVRYEIDYAMVETPEPATAMYLALAAACGLVRQRRSATTRPGAPRPGAR